MTNMWFSRIIGLGLCSGYTSLDAMPGWISPSWGYHGHNGNLFDGSLKDKAYSYPYGYSFRTGDVVGCYFTFDKGIAFTKNGASFGEKSDDILVDHMQVHKTIIRQTTKGIAGKLYPVVGMQSRGACIRVNFGHERFRYDVLSV